MNNDQIIRIIPMNSKRFETYLMFTRTPLIKYVSKELEHYSNESETILGVVIHDFTDDDFVYILLARDEVNHFRAFEVEASVESLDEARRRLHERMRWFISQNIKSVDQGDRNGKKPGVNLFVDQIPESKQHLSYKILKNEVSHLAAKQLLLEIEKFYSNIDKNFIEQFQSVNGFDARLWEIYLYCLFTEEWFSIVRTHDRPDFILEKADSHFAVEAVIVGRKEDEKKPIGVLRHKTMEETREENRNAMPLRFSSALDSKLKKKYWTLPHVQGKPLIIAIADFHDEMAMTWSFSALLELLYGYRHSFYHEQSGDLVITPVKVEGYTKPSGAQVPSGFFFWPDSEHISAVLFSSTATLAKFNRLGKQAGFGSKKSTLLRVGARHHHDPSASMPLPFQYIVDENSHETWGEGASLYHNPRAALPIDRNLFPNFGHHYFDNGQIVSHLPDFHPYFSITYNTITG